MSLALEPNGLALDMCFPLVSYIGKLWAAGVLRIQRILGLPVGQRLKQAAELEKEGR